VSSNSQLCVHDAMQYHFEYCLPIISKSMHFCCSCTVLDEMCSMEWGSSCCWYYVDQCIFCKDMCRKRFSHFRLIRYLLTSKLLCQLLLFPFFLLWGGTRSLHMPVLRPVSQAGTMCNPRDALTLAADSVNDYVTHQTQSH